MTDHMSDGAKTDYIKKRTEEIGKEIAQKLISDLFAMKVPIEIMPLILLACIEEFKHQGAQLMRKSLEELSERLFK